MLERTSHERRMRQLHSFSSDHRREIEASEQVGCFYCSSVYDPKAIEEWVDEAEDGNGTTALCAKCGIDSVLPGTKVELSPEVLADMREFWF